MHSPSRGCRAAAKAEKHGSEEAWKRHEILKRKVLDKPKLTAAAKQEKLQQKYKNSLTT